MTKMITTVLVAAALVGVVFCGGNTASAMLFESFEGWGGEAEPAPGWTGSSLAAAVTTADGNVATNGADFLAFNGGYAAQSAKFTAADAGVDLTPGFYFDYYMGSSDPGSGLYFQVNDVNSTNIIEIIMGANAAVIEGSAGKETVLTYPSSSGEWRHVVVIPDYDNETVTLEIDGVMSASASARGNMGGLTGFNSMLFYAANNAGIDALGVIPEPATAALICLGAALMVRRRH